jgi:hypothetical protein
MVLDGDDRVIVEVWRDGHELAVAVLRHGERWQGRFRDAVVRELRFDGRGRVERFDRALVRLRLRPEGSDAVEYRAGRVRLGERRVAGDGVAPDRHLVVGNAVAFGQFVESIQHGSLAVGATVRCQRTDEHLELGGCGVHGRLTRAEIRACYY